MPIKKIGDLPKSETCLHPEHNPPQLIDLPSGVYEYMCPSCARKITFTVRRAI